jgi:hypothetical protein
MIPNSGLRFSEKIVFEKIASARLRFSDPTGL